MSVPLTAELLAKRTVALHARCTAAGGSGDLVFNIVECDGCGAIVDLLTEFPRGWTTTGDIPTGFVDHCEECSP